MENKKKYLVLTICTGEKYKEMAAITHPLMKEYADKLDADFKVITENTCSTSHWEKFQIYDLLTKYERIVYIDTDIIIRPDAENILDYVPKDCFGAFNEAPFTENRRLALFQTCEAYNTTLPNWNGKYYNTGVMVVSRIHREFFKKPSKEIFNFYEQSYLNLVIHKNEVKCMDLPYKFNRMTCMDKVLGEERFASFFIHYAGVPSLEMVLHIMKNDIEKLKKDAPDYKYQRHILIDVQGGLGDQIDAEPSIRYMRDYIYPGQDIIIKSHFPRLFEHLGLPNYYHTDFVPKFDTPYYHVITLPGPETVQWALVSNLLCHTVDYCSIALLRRIIPTENKKILLPVKQEELDEVQSILGKDVKLEDLVLVHAGKHWVSKTFPKKWWQEVVDGLHAKGLKVCLIGKDEDTRGVWDLELREGMYDTRNLLSLGGLIALISKAKTLVSNDSGPVHLAGGFDNNIVLIPTCKHPDHILPYRGSDRSYKQIALYKKLTLDDCAQAPTEVHGASGEFIKRPFNEYLPETQTVVEETVRISK